MSKTHDPLELDQRFSANGVVSSSKNLSEAKWQQFDMEGVFSVTDSLNIIEDDYSFTFEVAHARPD
jgi:hypothetical protein